MQIKKCILFHGDTITKKGSKKGYCVNPPLVFNSLSSAASAVMNYLLFIFLKYHFIAWILIRRVVTSQSSLAAKYRKILKQQANISICFIDCTQFYFICCLFVFFFFRMHKPKQVMPNVKII